jgi:cytochrome c1
VTDHKSLSHLQDQSLSTEMQSKTMVKLVGLQFKLQYRKGPNNKAANALSRVGHNFALQSSSMVVPVWLQEVTNAYATDPTAQRLLQELAIVSPNEEGYSLFRYKKKIWIATNSALQTKIISAFHASAIGGHSGIQATLQRVSKLFWWKSLKQDVTSFIQQCNTCQQAKHESCKTPRLLNPLPIPENV